MTINSRTLWTTLSAVLVAAVAIVALSAQAPAGPGSQRGLGPGRGFGPGPMGMLRGIDLTDAQRDEIRAIVGEGRDEAAGRKAAELRRELHAALFADTPDLAKIDQLKAAIAEADLAALAAHIETHLKISQVLTAEQRAKARELPGPGLRGRGGPAR